MALWAFHKQLSQFRQWRAENKEYHRNMWISSFRVSKLLMVKISASFPLCPRKIRFEFVLDFWIWLRIFILIGVRCYSRNLFWGISTIFHTYVLKYIWTSIHICIYTQAYIRTWILACILTYLHIYNPQINIYIYSYMHSPRICSHIQTVVGK